MPHRIFHVVGVHGPVQFKLLRAVLKPAGVVKRNTALPMVRSLGGGEFDELVEVGNGLVKIARSKVLGAALLKNNRPGIQLRGPIKVSERIGVILHVRVQSPAQKPCLRVGRLHIDRLGGQGKRLVGAPGLHGFPRLFQQIFKFSAPCHGIHEEQSKQDADHATGLGRCPVRVKDERPLRVCVTMAQLMT